MTNLEFFRHRIAYCMDAGEGFGVIEGIPMPCSGGKCGQCLACRHRLARTNETACDTERIIDWMLAEHKEGLKEC